MTEEQKTFTDLGVDPRIVDSLTAKGITSPFPIQDQTIPFALEGNDLIGQARTGSGKTLAFGIPALQNIDPSRREVQVLMVTPTRELCVQVAEELTPLAHAMGMTVQTVYGGVSLDNQADALRKGVHIVAGTPGRLLDHIGRRNLDLSTIKVLVLDEADEMLDMGFLPDVERLIDACGDEYQTMLFSATMPTAIVNLARRLMDSPTFMRAETEELTIPDRMQQHFFQVFKMDKPRVLARILQDPNRHRVYVFTRTKYMADRLVDELADLGVAAVAIHGDLKQHTREKHLDKFRGGKADVLVATEVAARGLDVEDVTHVVNYDLPDDEKLYLHRIGRTARAGEAGVAITFATPEDAVKLNVIRKALDLGDSTEVHEVFSTSELLTELFDLPDETPWAHLGRAGSSSSSRSSSRGSSDRDRGDRDRNDRGRSDRDRKDRDRGRGDGRSRDRDNGASDARSSDRKRDTDRDGGKRPSARDERPGDGRRERDERPAREAAPSPDRSNGSERTRERTRATGDATERTRTRTRSRSTSSAPAATRERTRGDGGTSERERGRDSSRDRASSSGERKGDGQGRGGQRRSSGGSSSRDNQSRDNQSRGGARSGSGRGGSSSQRGSSPRSDSDGQRPKGERPTKRGPEARGDGKPAFERKVRVEHLP